MVPVRDFILESEQNLDVATAIYEQYEDARKSIMRSFLDRLAERLKKKLPGWTAEYEPSEFFTNRYACFHLFKPHWSKMYTIVLEAYMYGDRMIYGVWRNEDRLGGTARSPELLGAIRKTFSEAKSRTYYEAEIPFTSPATDWRKPAVLWRIHADETFLAEVEALLLEVVELAEKQIDVLVKASTKDK